MSTVGEALSQWRQAHGRSAEDAVGRVFWISLGPVRVPVPNPGQLRWHDLHHLVLGYEPDLIGEMEISAFELRTGVTTFMVLLLCLSGVGLGLIVAPRRTLKAWRNAKARRNLYGLKVPWNELQAWELSRLRGFVEGATVSLRLRRRPLKKPRSS
jgi:hypothetical protein